MSIDRRDVIKTFPLCLSLLLVGSLLSSCSARPAWEAESDVRVHPIASRQLPPEQVYSRVRWVHPPEVLPSRQVSTGQGKPRVLPIIHLKLQNASLEEAARVVAASARYQSFVSSSASNKRVTIQSLGTIDELAEELAKKTNTEVLVDHETRSVRFLESLPTENLPSFSDY